LQQPEPPESQPGRRRAGVYDDARTESTLISAQENIDETPAGQLMHGILAAFNEYRSNSDVADIRYKMGQMTKNGGTLGQAKFGYLNVREKIDGYEIRTVATDPERAQYVRLAFELAATGNYTMQRLADVLTERVLWLRPRNRRPAGPISANYLSRVLRDRYYMGFVNYKGEEYQGRHEPLVSAELFARVQAVLDERLPSPGERQRRHHHYLKGSLWCGRCHDKGVESRLLLTKEKGRGGEYWYFFCSARQDHACDAPYIRIEEAEAGVLRLLRKGATAGRLRHASARRWLTRWPTKNAAAGWCRTPE